MGGMGTIHEGNESRIYRENHLMTMNLLNASVEAGVKRFFFASSACVYPGNLQTNEHEDVSLRESDVYCHPPTPQGLYGAEKLNAEQLLLSSKNDMFTQIARFHNVYGPRGAWNNGREKAPAAMLRKAFVATALDHDHSIELPSFEVWGSGNQRRSFLFIDDAVNGVISLLKSKYQQPVNIGSDRSISIRELATIALRCAASPPVEVRYTSPNNHHPGVNTVGVTSRNSNNELVEKELGWKPKTSLEEGMKITGDWIGEELRKLTHHLPPEERLAALQELETSHVVDLTNDFTRFAILLPVTSRGSHSQETCLKNLAGFAHSLAATTYRDTHEVGAASFKFTIYLSIDHDDHFLLEGRAEEALRNVGDFDIVTVKAKHEKGHVCAHWRDCARRAFEAGCDYFTLLGDDVTLKDEGWMRKVHDEFKRLENERRVPFGFGCVAFTDITFPGMPTFPVVHKTHMEIFDGLVVPEVFFNQDGDPFLFQLYRRWGCSGMIEAQVGNGVGGSEGARYDKKSATDWTFDTLDKAVAKVEGWLSRKAPSIEKLLILDVIIPSYRVDLKFLDPILRLRPPETCSVMFIIIVDDPNSPSINLLQQKYGADPFVRIRVNKTNLGASASRNRGMKESAADWVHFLDDDVTPDNDLLDQTAKVILEHPNVVGFVGTSKFPIADSVFTTAIHLADVTHFWDIARKRPEDKDLPWGVTANLIARRNADGVDFDLIFPKTGGGEDIDFCRRKRDWMIAKSGEGSGGFHAARSVVVTHPWWNNGQPSLWRFYGWSKGDGALVKLYPEFRYRDFAPSSGETLLLCLLAFFIGLLVPLDSAHQGECVSLSFCGAIAVVLANVSHSIYKICFPDYDRWKFQECTVTGPKYALAIVVSAFIRVASETGRAVGMLKRGEIMYLGGRFDWFAGGGGRDPIVNERRGSLQRFALFVVFTICLRALQLTVGRAFFPSSLDY